MDAEVKEQAAKLSEQEEIKKDQKEIEESKTELKSVKETGKKEIVAAMDKAGKEFEAHKTAKIVKKELKKQVKEILQGDEKKVYSQQQYDEGVRNAAKQAATDAVKHLRSLDKKNAQENQKLKDQIG